MDHIGPIMDVETTESGTVIVIDLLVDMAGKTMPRDRSLSAVMESVRGLIESGIAPEGLARAGVLQHPVRSTGLLC